MATNEILPFAQDGAALVQTQAAYAADLQRPLGHQPGVARPDFANKAARQASAIASGIAQFLADNQAANITDSLTAAALSTIIYNAIKSITLMPAGSVIWVPGLNVPAGTVKLNGALLSRTTYARLWTFAQLAGNVTTDANWTNFPGIFSSGDGSTNFRLPDLRGYSLRALDDGRGIDVSRAVGTIQDSQNLSHQHAMNDPGHFHGYVDPGHLHGTTVNDPTHFHNNIVNRSNESGSTDPFGSGAGGGEGSYTWATASAATNITVGISNNGVGITINPVLTGVSTQVQGGSEVRVKNIAMLPVMFY